LTKEAKLKTKLRELEFITASSRALNATLDLDQLLGVIIKLVREAVNAEAVSLLFLDDDGENLVFELARGRRDSAVRGLKVPVGEGIIGWVAEHRQPLVVNDTSEDPRYSKELEGTLGVSPRSVLAVPLVRRDRLVGVLDAINRKKGSFTDDDLSVATALGEHVAAAVANARLYAVAKRRSLEYSMLARVGADFGRSLTLDEALERVLGNLRKLISFDAAAIFLVDRDEKRIQSVLHQGYPRGVDERINLKSDEGVVGLAARRKRAVIVHDVLDNDRYVDARPQTRSEMVVPMVVRGQVIGLFNVESNDVAAYDDDDRRLVESFALQAAVAIERAHLYEQQSIKREIEEELAVARTVQSFFTPQHSFTAGAFKMFGINYPSLEVSGDYVDYFPVRGGRVAFAVADVAGKGMPASLIMSSFRATLHTLAPYLCSARQITHRANTILLETVRPQDFVTAFIGVLDPKTGEVTYCNAGHNPPVLMSPDGAHRLLETGGPILGVFEDPLLEEGRLILRGEVLLCYTDGATEARNESGEEYGEARLADSLRRHADLTPYHLTRAINADLRSYCGDRQQSDDVTYLALRRAKR
jgi:sigma-B regulation protein RsbU (phosphoserine phosphatase)